MKYPMIAISKVFVGEAEYDPGAVFDAGKEKTYNFLLAQDAAKPYQEEGKKVQRAEPEVVKTESATVAQAPDTQTGNVVKSTEGTSNGKKGVGGLFARRGKRPA